LGPRASGRSLRYQRTTISPQHQITVPSVPFADAGLGVGDRLHATADGPGRVILERIDPPPQLLPPSFPPTTPTHARK